MERMTSATRRTPVLYFDCVLCGETKHRNQFPPSAVHTNVGRRRCSMCPQITRPVYMPRKSVHRGDRAFDRAHPIKAVSLEVPARCPHCDGYIKVMPYPAGHALGLGGFRCLNCGRGEA